jgi:hypothetical protein
MGSQHLSAIDFGKRGGGLRPTLTLGRVAHISLPSALWVPHVSLLRHGFDGRETPRQLFPTVPSVGSEPVVCTP